MIENHIVIVPTVQCVLERPAIAIGHNHFQPHLAEIDFNQVVVVGIAKFIYDVVVQAPFLAPIANLFQVIIFIVQPKILYVEDRLII